MDVWREMIESIGDPRLRHAAFVHTPLALGFLGLLASIVSALCPRNHVLRAVAVSLFALMLASAFFATGSGEDALAKAGPLPDEARARLHDHEEMGEKVWLFALAAGALLGAGFLRPRAAKVAFSWAGVVAALGAAGWVAVVGHHGGTLVYRHAVGSPPAPPPASGEVEDPRVEFFLTTVRPILVDNCMGCHEEWMGETPGGLDLTTAATLLKGGESGAAIVPGRPEESLLIQSVTWEHPKLRMPKRLDKLSDEQIEALRRWIREGAVWR